MPKFYKVWICVEENDEEADTYEDIYLPFGSLLETDDIDEAVKFATDIQSTNGA